MNTRTISSLLVGLFTAAGIGWLGTIVANLLFAGVLHLTGWAWLAWALYVLDLALVVLSALISGSCAWLYMEVVGFDKAAAVTTRASGWLRSKFPAKAAA